MFPVGRRPTPLRPQKCRPVHDCRRGANAVILIGFMPADIAAERQEKCDVAVIGTGPAGMFAALELAERVPAAKIVMFERGPIRPMGDRANVSSGWGGA